MWRLVFNYPIAERQVGARELLAMVKKTAEDLVGPPERMELA